MDRKWSGLWAGLLCAGVFLSTVAPEAALAPLRDLPWGNLAAWALNLELGTGPVYAAPSPEAGTPAPASGADEPGPSPEAPPTAPAAQGTPLATDTPETPPMTEAPGTPPVTEVPETPPMTDVPAATAAPEGGTPPAAPEPSPTAPAAEETPATAAGTPEPTAEVRDMTDHQGVAVKNNTGFDPDIEAMLSAGPSQRLSAGGPQILIIHTHSTEAYRPAPGEEYEATDPYRTTDPEHSVIRVGDVLQEALEAQGLQVVHDRGLFDYPSYTGSYTRSGEAVEAWLAKYPTIGVVIDLHRDAVGTEQVLYRTVAQVSGGDTAQVMLVVGTGENGLEHPLWQENLRLALALQRAMDEQSPTLTRPIHLTPERYNQQLTTGSLILEVGTNGNTLSEAIRAAELFAQAAGPVFLSLIQ